MRTAAIVRIRILPLDALFPVILTVSFHLRSEEQVQTDGWRFAPAELYAAISTPGASAGTTVSAKRPSKARRLLLSAVTARDLGGGTHRYRQNTAAAHGVTSSRFPIHDTPLAHADFGKALACQRKKSQVHPARARG